MSTQCAPHAECALYQKDPITWAQQTAPKLLHCIVADMAAGLKWESRWVWVATPACRSLHAGVLALADDAIRGDLWAEESIEAKAILLAMLPDDVRATLWRDHTSNDTRQSIRAHVERVKLFAGAPAPPAHHSQQGLFV